MHPGGLRLFLRPKRALARAKAPESDEAAAWHHLKVEDAFERLETRPEGLTLAEAGERLARLGRNEIVRRKPVSPLGLLARQFANFFVLVLLSIFLAIRLTSALRNGALKKWSTGVLAYWAIPLLTVP